MKLLRVLALASFLFLASIPACRNTRSMTTSTPVPILHPTEPEKVTLTRLPTISITESKIVIDSDPILIEKARNDLAERLDLPVEQIHVVEASEVTWPDSNLGFLPEGML